MKKSTANTTTVIQKQLNNSYKQIYPFPSQIITSAQTENEWINCAEKWAELQKSNGNEIGKTKQRI